MLVCLMLHFTTNPVLAADPAQVKDMIERLSQGFGQDELAGIYEAISEVSEPSIKLELKQALYAKLDSLFEPKSKPDEEMAVTNAKSANPIANNEQQFLTALNAETTRMRLRAEIEALQFGPQATADTMRRRDDLLDRIAQIPNPDVRDELLQFLEERERSADSVPAGTLNQ